MAIRGLSLSDEQWYVCREDPGKRDTLDESLEAGATVFFYRPIPAKVMTRIHDMQQSASVQMGETTTQTFHQKVAAKNYEAFRFGITRWENFLDDSDEPIKIDRENVIEGMQNMSVISASAMNAVRLSTINEVGAHIFNTNSLGETERKKFEELLSQLGTSETGIAPSATTDSDESEGAKDPPNTKDESSTSTKQKTRKRAK